MLFKIKCEYHMTLMYTFKIIKQYCETVIVKLFNLEMSTFVCFYNIYGKILIVYNYSLNKKISEYWILNNITFEIFVSLQQLFKYFLIKKAPIL